MLNTFFLVFLFTPALFIQGAADRGRRQALLFGDVVNSALLGVIYRAGPGACPRYDQAGFWSLQQIRKNLCNRLQDKNKYCICNNKSAFFYCST
jgi:hypothetical protein